jgi:hypothetical protein
MRLADPYSLLQDVCDRELGFQPLNFSIKEDVPLVVELRDGGPGVMVRRW